MKTTLHLARRHARSIFLLAVALQTGCGAAHSLGRGAAEGALGKLAGQTANPERLEALKRRAIASTINEIAQPEALGSIERIAAAFAAGAFAGVSASRAPIEAMSAQAARAFSREITAELSRSGEGSLANTLSATGEQMTASLARGAQDELSPLFPECRGAEAPACLDRAVERVSRASAAGVAAGIRESLGIWPLVLAFGGGALFVLAIAWAWALFTARRPARPR